MLARYIQLTMDGIPEDIAQHLVEEAYTNQGWSVKNVHESDRRFERGADLVAERASEREIVAVKRKPGKQDLPQLEALRQRAGEGKLVYVHTMPPTEPFLDGTKRVSGLVTFLGPEEFHKFLVRGESIGYLLRIFTVHPFVQELADAISLMWLARRVGPPAPQPTYEDLNAIWSLKDAALKYRACLGMVILRHEDRIKSDPDLVPERFEEILDAVLQDLDLVQRFTGTALVSAFLETQSTTPHILAQLWSSFRPRTYWKEFALRAESMRNRDEVAAYARSFWVLPNAAAVGEARQIRHGMRGFLSGLSGILESLSKAFRDMDEVVDIAWMDARTSSSESIYKPRPG